MKRLLVKLGFKGVRHKISNQKLFDEMHNVMGVGV